MTMPEYNSLADLRAALSSDNADRRSQAYEVVLSRSNVGPTDVLGGDPPEQELVDANVIPEPTGGGRPVSELDEERNEVLKDIRDVLEGST